MYQLIVLNKWDYSDYKVLMSGNLNLLKSRYNILLKYNKHFICCPKNKRQRLLFKNIERKLIKELHGQSPSNNLFDFLYNHHICILNTNKQTVYCNVRLHKVVSGLIPLDYKTNDDYKNEKWVVKFFLENTWQRLHIKPTFKYFTLG